MVHLMPNELSKVRSMYEVTDISWVLIQNIYSVNIIFLGHNKAMQYDSHHALKVMPEGWKEE